MREENKTKWENGLENVKCFISCVNAITFALLNMNPKRHRVYRNEPFYSLVIE